MSTNHYSSTYWVSWWNLSKNYNLNWYVLIRHSNKRIHPRALAPKPKDQKLDYENFNGKNYQAKGVWVVKYTT